MLEINRIQTLQYMGSKSRMLDSICIPIGEDNDIDTVIDLFAGTGSVGYALSPYKRIISMRISRGAEKAWVFTTSGFTPEGRDEARITGVNLVNGEKLIESLDIYYPGRFCL